MLWIYGCHNMIKGVGVLICFCETQCNADSWSLYLLGEIENGYHHANPYHNAVHATDVTQAMNCYINEQKVCIYFMLIVAASCCLQMKCASCFQVFCRIFTFVQSLYYHSVPRSGNMRRGLVFPGLPAYLMRRLQSVLNATIRLLST